MREGADLAGGRWLGHEERVDLSRVDDDDLDL
jgi:hypothetical protein